MSQSFTRRGFVKAAPVVAIAVALPASAVATVSGPDGELLLLAKEFDRLHREWKELDVAAARLEQPFPKTMPLEEIWRRREESGLEEAATLLHHKHAEIDAVADRMRELAPQTLQGLAAKARLAQFDVHLSSPVDMEGPESDWDWNVLSMDRFVHEIERFAAIHAPGGLNA